MVTNPAKRSFSLKFKLDVVQRFLVGDTKVSLATENERLGAENAYLGNCEP